MANRIVRRIVSRKITLPVTYNELLCESEQLERHENYYVVIDQISEPN